MKIISALIGLKAIPLIRYGWLIYDIDLIYHCTAIFRMKIPDQNVRAKAASDIDRPLYVDLV